ncbi:polyketide synthase dehydratase domain-containing protein, partial [Streptomyces sp. UNOC14_S4]|uniref:SpnB-like Rossmann fold domain-containing protein n=1 Tax=Streptomyces sp. UNOC14_S4 TaxID=2872340 RepID=UPI001E2B11A4
ALWRRGEELFAEVRLPGDEQTAPGGFGLHPALLEAASHALLVAGAPGAPAARVATGWGGVRLYATGASALRVRLVPDGSGGAYAMQLADRAGEPVASVDSVVLRALSPDGIGDVRERRQDALFDVAWRPIALAGADPDIRWGVLGDGEFTGRRFDTVDAVAAALESGAPVDAVVVPWVPTAGTDTVTAVHGSTQRILGLVQEWLADDRLTATPLLVLTHGAVATVPGEDITDLAAATVWGLLRSAQSEAPGRITIADADTVAPSTHVLAALVAAREPQAALRDGTALVPRLDRTT